MRRKHQKKSPMNADQEQVDPMQVLDPDDFYWTVLRPMEEAATEKRKRRRAQRAFKQHEKAAPDLARNENPVLPLKPGSEQALIQLISDIICTTHHANGWRHLGELGQALRQHYAAIDWSDYGSKKLLNFLEKHAQTFQIKWSAPRHKGASHVWVRLTT